MKYSIKNLKSINVQRRKKLKVVGLVDEIVNNSEDSNFDNNSNINQYNKQQIDMLPEYEKKRLQNIARNEAHLKSLGLGTSKKMFREIVTIIVVTWIPINIELLMS